jgi:DNA polymerase V
MAESLFSLGQPYKKAGVVLSGLVPEDAIQANMFENAKPIGRFLMDMVDNINFGMRGDVVKFASSGTTRDWKMRREFHSPRYTTRWDELCEVK